MTWSLKREEQKEPLKQLTLKVSTVPSPSDWSVPVAFSCSENFQHALSHSDEIQRSCLDCGVLIRFLKHPTKTQHRFLMHLWGYARCSHLEFQLSRCVAMGTCSTERHG